MKKLFITTFILCGLAGFRAEAQQQFMITQYMFNGLAMNPAYAGIHDGLSLSFLARDQWTGLQGAPKTQFFSVHSPLRYQPISLGMLLYRDVIGVKKEHTGYFSYAYRIHVSEKMQLSFGLQANIHQLNQDFVLGAADDPNDPVLDQDNFVKFNAGSGLLLHSDKFYVGFSVPSMLKTKFGSSELNSQSRMVQHYYLMAGYVFGISNELMLKPNVLLKAVGNAPAQVDINLNALIKNILWIGISHRWKESFDALAALQVGPRMQIGYAADLNSNDINRASHEIMINYIVDYPRSKILTPRYF